jgi:hypothetical protein
MSVVVGPPTKPTSIALAEEDAELRAMVVDQLKNARTAAEGWQKGLAGLLTVLTSVLFLKGKESIDEISSGWQYFVAAVLISAGIAAVASAFFLLRASYGSPSEAELDDIREQGVYLWRFRQAKRSSDDLAKGQVGLVLMLLLVAGAVLITWFAPGSSKSPFQVADDAGNCGTLEKADNGQFKIVADEKASATIIPATDLAKLHVVAKCP